MKLFYGINLYYLFIFRSSDISVGINSLYQSRYKQRCRLVIPEVFYRESSILYIVVPRLHGDDVWIPA